MAGSVGGMSRSDASAYTMPKLAIRHRQVIGSLDGGQVGMQLLLSAVIV